MNRIVGIATAAAVLLIGAVAASAEPETLAGKVVSIADGDTLTVLVDKHAFGKVVTVKASGKDRYGRVIAPSTRVVYLSGCNVGQTTHSPRTR